MKLGCEGGDWEPGNLVMCKDFGRLNNGDRFGLLNLSAINFRKTATITSSGAPAEGFNFQRRFGQGFALFVIKLQRDVQVTKLIGSTAIEGEVVRTDALIGVDSVSVLDSEVSLFFCMAGICPQQSTNYQGSYRAFSFNDVHGSPVVIVTSGGQLHGFRCPYGFLARLAVDVVDAQG